MKIKKVIVFLNALLLVFSCNQDDSPSFDSQFYGQWKLISMQGSASTETQTGDNMLWQESYTFNSDGSVLKQREQDGNTSIINGDFEQFIGNGIFPAMKIIYDTEDKIIGSCYTKEEYVYLESPTQMIGEWEQCDGPSLVYAKQ